jgi:hypothetical protein
MEKKPLEKWWDGRPGHRWNDNIKTYENSSWYCNQRLKNRNSGLVRRKQNGVEAKAKQREKEKRM